MNVDQSFWIADCDGGGVYVAGEEVSESLHSSLYVSAGIFIGCSGQNPTTFSTVEFEVALRIAMVELVQLNLAELSAKSHLVLPLNPREVIGDLAGDVVPALGRSAPRTI